MKGKTTAILVTTFLRDKLLFRCIESIRRYYPDIPIFVGDNGRQSKEKEKFCAKHKCTLLHLDFDLGVGGTRNAAIALIPKEIKYLVICEDDIIFTAGTKLETWKRILDSDSGIGIVGGLLKLNEKQEQHYEGFHRIDGDVKYADKVTDPKWIKSGKSKYFLCDLVLNVFMMRLSLWRGGSKVCKTAIRWDPQFKTALEHADFFLNAKYALRDGQAVRRRKAWHIAYTPDVWLYHKHETPSQEYADFRNRTVGFDLFAKKWNLTYSYSDYNKQNPTIYNKERAEEGRTKEGARAIWKAAVKALDKSGIKWWLMSGSLLGAVREGGFIAHDPDIDIGIAPGQIKDWGKIKEAFKRAGFSLYKEWIHKQSKTKIELSFIKYGIKVDLFFWYEKGNRYWYGAFCPDKAGQWGEHMECVPRSFPRRLFKEFEPTVFEGQPARIPKLAEEYLVHQYGEDWRVPRKDWKYWQDCCSVDRGVLKDNSTVFIAGAWDKIDGNVLDLFDAAVRIGGNLHIGIYTDEVLAKDGQMVRVPYAERERLIKSLSIVEKTTRIEHIEPVLHFQRVGFCPDYYISDGKSDLKTVEYVEVFGGRSIHRGELIAQAPSKSAEIIIHDRAREDKIAIGIKTFLREENLYRTLKAIKDNFPYPYRLYIADDGGISTAKADFYADLESEGHKIIKLPFDVGISVGRNAIIKAAMEDYVLIMDDDIAIEDGKAIKDMKAILDGHADIGIAAGTLKHEMTGTPFGSPGYSKGVLFEQKGCILFRNPAHGSPIPVNGTCFRYADQAVNFFLAKREVFEDVRWDDRIKVEWEHMDFFLRLKETDWKVAVCPDAVAIHLKPRHGNYDYDAYRRSAPMAYFTQKHGISRINNRWR